MTEGRQAARIVGVAHAVPEQVVTNDMLAEHMDTSDEWVQQRAGIKERRWVRPLSGAVAQGELCSNADLAVQASTRVFASSGTDPNSIDAIVYATVSPDQDIPGTGVSVLNRLLPGRDVPVVEVRNQCSGFLYGLLVATTYIESGVYKRILLIGSEVQSTGLHVATGGRDTAVLFGDGCGAAILEAGCATQGGVLTVRMESDGRYADKLGVLKPEFAVERPLVSEDFEGENPEVYPRMEGKFVFKMASVKMPEIVRKVLAEQSLSIDDVSLVVPHQANQRIIDMVARDLGVADKIFSNIARYGNTTAASIPLALSEACEAGRISPGDLICLASFGAGFSWGAALIRW